MESKISLMDSIRYGFESYKRHFKFFILLGAVFGVLALIDKWVPSYNDFFYDVLYANQYVIQKNKEDLSQTVIFVANQDGGVGYQLNDLKDSGVLHRFKVGVLARAFKVPAMMQVIKNPELMPFHELENSVGMVEDTLRLTRKEFITQFSNHTEWSYFIDFYLLPLIYLLIIGLVQVLLLSWLVAGAIAIALEIYKTGISSFSCLFSKVKLVPRVFLVSLILSIPMFFGRAISPLFIIYFYWLLLKIPFGLLFSAWHILVFCLYIFLLIRLFFAAILIVNKNVGALESLKRSFTLTKGHAFKVGILVLLFLIITLMIVKNSYLLFTGITFFFLMVVVDLYHKLLKKSGTSHGT